MTAQLGERPTPLYISEHRADLRMIGCYVAVAEEGSLRRAAGRLAMDSSVISRRIRSFEAALGVQLLIRKPGQPLKLTHAGRAVLERGKDILDRYDALVMEAHRATNR